MFGCVEAGIGGERFGMDPDAENGIGKEYEWYTSQSIRGKTDTSQR